MAVENDYDLLVHNLNELAQAISWLRDEVERRRLQEAREQLERNQTDWVNLIAYHLLTTESSFRTLRDGARAVLDSQPGEALFSAQPPSAPDAP